MFVDDFEIRGLGAVNKKERETSMATIQHKVVLYFRALWVPGSGRNWVYPLAVGLTFSEAWQRTSSRAYVMGTRRAPGECAGTR